MSRDNIIEPDMSKDKVSRNGKLQTGLIPMVRSYGVQSSTVSYGVEDDIRSTPTGSFSGFFASSQKRDPRV
jgi:hypothetical protein